MEGKEAEEAVKTLRDGGADIFPFYRAGEKKEGKSE